MTTMEKLRQRAEAELVYARALTPKYRNFLCDLLERPRIPEPSAANRGLFGGDGRAVNADLFTRRLQEQSASTDLDNGGCNARFFISQEQN